MRAGSKPAARSASAAARFLPALFAGLLGLTMPMRLMADMDAIFDMPQRWIEDSGRAVSLSQWKGHYVALSMFYVGCRKICPQTVTRMEDLHTALLGHGIDLQLVLVSYAAEAETAQSLAGFRQRHALGAQWHLLAGSREATQTLADRIGLGEFNAMDDHIFHDAGIVVFDPAGRSRVLDWKHGNQSLVDAMTADSAGPKSATRQDRQAP